MVVKGLIVLLSIPFIAGAGSESEQAAGAGAPWDVTSPLRRWTAELPAWLKLTGEIRGRFDSLYPTNIYGTAADLGWRNLHEAVLSAEWQPDKKTKLKTAYHWFRLAQQRDALYTFSGAVFVSAPNARDRGVGSEVDVRWVRQMSKSLQFWLGYAHLFPGPYLKQAGRGAIDYPYVMYREFLSRSRHSSSERT